MSDWLLNNELFDAIPDNHIGFIYRITNVDSGRMYIGKKGLYSNTTVTRTIKLKSGIKKRKKVKLCKESDWRNYYGSSEELLKDIELLGKDSFKREILHLCKTKGEMSYMEAEAQFREEVLLYPDRFYNGFIGCKIHRTHVKHMVKSAIIES